MSHCFLVEHWNSLEESCRFGLEERQNLLHRRLGNTSNRVHAIYFYNGQRDGEEMGGFCGRTDKAVNWEASADEVKNAYGHPTGEYSGTDPGGTWQRLVFAGIALPF